MSEQYSEHVTFQLHLPQALFQVRHSLSCYELLSESFLPTHFFREDYDKLSQFVSDKKLRVKNKVKVADRPLGYQEDGSSDSDHDAYLQRVKAEGEDRDSEDGMYLVCVYRDSEDGMYLCVWGL